MKIKLNIGTVVDAITSYIDPALLAKAEVDSRWQLGQAVMNGFSRPVERKMQLGEWIYRYKGQLIDPKNIEMYQQNEWIDWRDA